MTEAEKLAEYISYARPGDLSEPARSALKSRVLDALGCAIGALRALPVARLRQQIDLFGGKPLATLIAAGKSSPDRAALYNGALVRYLDFNDSYLAKGETCHPSDNLSAVLAAAEYADANGADFLLALAVAYQVQCQLSDAAPVRSRGFDHTTQGAYALAAGIAKALRMTPEQTANAIAISGTAYNALRVTRTGRLSHWKALAYPNTAFGVMNAAFLAKFGVTGPAEVFEGNKGFRESIAGPFSIQWRPEGLGIVLQTILKKHNAEIHSQSAIEAALELRAAHAIDPAAIRCIEIDIFDVAYAIIGGGEEGGKRFVSTKEEADHSLPYIVSAALLDGAVTPSQYAPERILRHDIQQLLRKVIVRPDASFSRRFPLELPVRVRISLEDGRKLEVEKSDYEGFHTRPMPWAQVAAKFESLAAPFISSSNRRAIVDCVAHLEQRPVRELTNLLRETEIRSAA